MLTVPVKPRDPLKNFQFTISLVGGAAPLVVGAVQRVSGLSATVSAFEVWEGGNNLHRYANPDKVTWDPITLEQGIALDSTLEVWAAGVQYFAMTGTLMASPAGDTSGGGQVAVKRNLQIDLWDPAKFSSAAASQAMPARRYHVFNAWISKYSALPKLDALASEAALLTVELIHEGWTVELLS